MFLNIIQKSKKGTQGKNQGETRRDTIAAIITLPITFLLIMPMASQSKICQPIFQLDSIDP